MLVWTGRLYGDVMGFSGRIQNLVDGSCFPCHTILLLYRSKNLYLSYDTLQPASHNILMDTKGVPDNLGTTCACVAALGSHGRSKLPVCVDWSVFKSGNCMTIGRVSG